MILNESKKETIELLESLQSICNAKADISIGKGKILWAGYGKAVGDAIAMLKEKAVEPDFLPGQKFGCPDCGSIIKIGNSYCWSCGRRLKWE